HQKAAMSSPVIMEKKGPKSNGIANQIKQHRSMNTKISYLITHRTSLERWSEHYASPVWGYSCRAWTTFTTSMRVEVTR
ncbi:hypothetical protein, partial [Pseudomonas syringae]|uniref:hypothetical protein n=1 Tax=Pseudomonas syringae TaxID=317 RepID=UPI001C808F3B